MLDKLITLYLILLINIILIFLILLIYLIKKKINNGDQR